MKSHRISSHRPRHHNRSAFTLLSCLGQKNIANFKSGLKMSPKIFISLLLTSLSLNLRLLDLDLTVLWLTNKQNINMKAKSSQFST